MKKLNLVGIKFGRLTVVEQAGTKNGRTTWRCLCDCGNTVIVLGSSLRNGNTRSCGCLHSEASRETGERLRGRRNVRKLIDLTGKTFGRLTVLEWAGRSQKGINLWKCQCVCGTVVTVRGDALRYGMTQSCGCLGREQSAERCRERCSGKPGPRARDLTGQRFGRLTVLRKMSIEEGAKRGHSQWVCRCDCGKITYPVTSKLTTGETQSCGCLGLERATAAKIKHGFAASAGHDPLYRVWNAMKQRCGNPNVSQYKYYGGKGVSVCEEWQTDFAVFRDWALANGYQQDLTIDRIDPNGDYCPENCRWITAFENRSRAHRKTREKEE